MRRFLLVCATALALATPAATAKSAATVDPVKAAQVQAITPLLEGLPEKDPALTLKSSDLRIEEWEVAILPWFAREGISNDVRAPVSIEWYFTPVGESNNVSGYTFDIDAFTDCRPLELAQGPVGPYVTTGPVWINAHYINPADSNYQDIGYIFTLTHELAHDQGICAGSSDYVESSTQLAALEVASAMANGGNKLAASSLLREWRDIILGSMVYDALRTNSLQEYYAFLRTQVSPADYGDRMSRYRARFTHKEDRAAWATVYRKYSYAVYVKAMWAVNGGVLRPSQHRPKNLFAPVVLVPSGRQLVMDDFIYFIRHADEITGQ